MRVVGKRKTLTEAKAQLGKLPLTPNAARRIRAHGAGDDDGYVFMQTDLRGAVALVSLWLDTFEVAFRSQDSKGSLPSVLRFDGVVIDGAFYVESDATTRGCTPDSTPFRLTGGLGGDLLVVRAAKCYHVSFSTRDELYKSARHEVRMIGQILAGEWT